MGCCGVVVGVFFGLGVGLVSAFLVLGLSLPLLSPPLSAGATLAEWWFVRMVGFGVEFGVSR